MVDGKFVSYLRVSTAKQGSAGLGMDAQRAAVASYLNGGSWKLVQEFVEVESGKSDHNRPKLAEAMAMCRLHGATLVVAKLDRLSRDVHFLTGLQKGSVRFVAADMPEANEMVVGMMAVIAQAERKMISARTKAALAEAKRRGTKLGGNPGNLAACNGLGVRNSAVVRTAKAADRAGDLAPVIAELREIGCVSLRAFAAGLNQRGIPTARGGKVWGAAQVARVLATIEGKAS